MRAFKVIALLIFISFGMPVFSWCDNSHPKSMKVGLVLGLTGAAAFDGTGIRRGVELAAEELKAKAWQIELKVEDDQTNPAKTVSAMQFLKAQDYSFFVGPTWSFQVNAVRQIVSKYELITIIPGGSSEINGGPALGVFNVSPSRWKQIPFLVKWLQDVKLKRGFIATPNGDWGEVHRQVFSRALKEAGGQIVGEEQFDFGVDTAALQSILLKAKQAKAEVLLTTGGPSDLANIIHARDALHLEMAILGTNGIRDAVTLNLISAKELQQNVFTIGFKMSPDFRRSYKAKFDEEPSLYADRGYDALMILAQAVEHTDGSAQAVRSYLSSTLNYTGVSGKIRFDSNGDVQAGDFQVLKAVDDK